MRENLHDMVESILKCGTFEARVTFRSPYAVSSVLGGAGRVRYAFWDGIRRDELLLKSDKRMLEMLEDRPDRDSRLLITFDDQLHYAELHNFFNRFGTVNHVILLDADVGQPRGAVVLFHNPEAVRNTLRGAQVLTLYHGEIEIRVRPYPTA
uniref:uncharacterized protein LOC101291286 n=1 Tax=Fragaria vesca subsp. vesca TaxID=101020 RepID=UPI0005CA10A2|nr:PREDICTED: uncharacterized protein LOC101291286 [Fragaria vesca subsp. vesca]